MEEYFYTGIKFPIGWYTKAGEEVRVRLDAAENEIREEMTTFHPEVVFGDNVSSVQLPSADVPKEFIKFNDKFDVDKFNSVLIYKLLRGF